MWNRRKAWGNRLFWFCKCLFSIGFLAVQPVAAHGLRSPRADFYGMNRKLLLFLKICDTLNLPFQGGGMLGKLFESGEQRFYGHTEQYLCG